MDPKTDVHSTGGLNGAHTENRAGVERKQVWVIESGDYEQRMVYAVAESVAAAAAFVKKPYGPPYIVQWDEPHQSGDDEWTLVGHFSNVPGYCGDEPSEWTFTAYDIETLPAPRTTNAEPVISQDVATLK